MRDEFSQILDSAWEETLPGDAKLCLADMKVDIDYEDGWSITSLQFL